jgi:hypothetical protein
MARGIGRWGDGEMGRWGAALRQRSGQEEQRSRGEFLTQHSTLLTYSTPELLNFCILVKPWVEMKT